MRARLPMLLGALLVIWGCPRAIPPNADWSDIPAFARVERLPGPLGDWALRNERLVVVVRNVGVRGGFAVNGGVIVDAAPTGGEGRIREIFTYLDDTFPRQALYEHLEPEGPDSAGAHLVARGADIEDPSLAMETRYTLAPGTNALRILTTVTNTGADTVSGYELGDAIQWGRALPHAPGPGRDLNGSTGPIPFLTAADGGTAYGWMSPGRDLTGPHGAGWSDPIVDTVTLAPGASATYERLFYVGRGSEADAAGWARSARGDATGTLQVRVRGARGESLGDVEVEARDDIGSLAVGRTDADGEAHLVLLPGTVSVIARDAHRGRVQSAAVRVDAGREAATTLELPAPARLRLLARDAEGRPSPAKWTFEGRDGTEDPRLGGDIATGSGRVVLMGSGTAEAEIPTGSYRVTASRGSFYEVWQTDISVEPGETRDLAARLSRLPVPEDWVSADLHVHAVQSVDSDVSLADRLVSAAAEGVDWFVATDHGHRTDYGDALRATALAAPVGVIVGEEVTTSRYGHFSAYPLRLRPGEPGSGALDGPRLEPRAIFDLLHAEGPEVLVQVNHPRTGRDGYFDRLESPPPEFDVLEVFSARQHDRPDAVWEDWMTLLRSGRHVIAVGNSDSHRLTGEEIGTPRNVLFPDPAAGAWTPESVTRAVRDGRVVVTTGPLVRCTVGGKGAGSTVTASPGTVTAHITVWGAAWVDVRRVTLYVNGEIEARFPVPPGGGAVRFDEDVEVPLRQSAFLVVRVEGDRSLDPVVPPRPRGSPGGPWTPLAVTNAIWVEIPSAAR